MTLPSTAQVAAEISNLQAGRTGTKDEVRIRNLLLSQRGAALTELKRLLDAGGDYRNTLQLIESDIDDHAVRIEIIAHLASAVSRSVPAPWKLLTDIDDTILSSLHDKRFKKGVVYPGVRAFQAELDAGHAPGRRRGDLVLLSARPEDRLGFMEDRTLRHLRASGIDQATLLPGEWTGLVNHEAMARVKLARFRAFAAINPEFDFVFTGDNGQGDALLAEALQKEPGDRVRGTFIHVVTAFDPGERERFEAAGVRFFETWVGAARLAEEAGLIDEDAVQRVVRAAEQEADAVNPDWRNTDWGRAFLRDATGPR